MMIFRFRPWYEGASCNTYPGAHIRERIGQVKADQKARGRYLGGKIPFGFRRDALRGAEGFGLFAIRVKYAAAGAQINGVSSFTP